MNTLTVSQTPVDERPSARPSCPYCRGRHLRGLGARHTLIGGGDGTRDGDPNHWHEEYECRDCGQPFTRETSDGKTWYTANDGLVLVGFPNCFESYVYTHADCGGRVARHYTSMDGETPAGSLCVRFTEGKSIREYRTFFRCDKCGACAETENDYPKYAQGGTEEPQQ